MTTFLLFTFSLICLGIFVRIFWKPLLIVVSILGIVLGIIVSAGLTAACFNFFHAMLNQGEWGNYSTYFAYSTVFFTVAAFIYVSVVGDIFEMAVNFLKNK